MCTTAAVEKDELFRPDREIAAMSAVLPRQPSESTPAFIPGLDYCDIPSPEHWLRLSEGTLAADKVFPRKDVTLRATKKK